MNLVLVTAVVATLLIGVVGVQTVRMATCVAPMKDSASKGELNYGRW
jgi:hypothetical protein